jgi:hypothetical protein
MARFSLVNRSTISAIVPMALSLASEVNNISRLGCPANSASANFNETPQAARCLFG